MKSTFTILLILVLVQFANPQSMVVNKNDGSKAIFPLSDVKSITFEDSDFLDSRDGHVYKMVKIGNQIWMAENLAYLPAVSPPTSGSNTAPYYYVYGYSGTDITAAKATANYSTYGVLYNWSAAKVACPSGWHLPSDAEWKQLEMNLGLTQEQAELSSWRGTDQGTQMKSSSGWYNNGNGTNTSGFAAPPGGDRYSDGHIDYISYYGLWWSATEYSASNAWNRGLYFNKNNVLRDNPAKDHGFSVRCVKD
jgi:uncharacterized protein (TIGR02145 family)